ncbi:hypothetical protein NQ314_000668 [Rhamnusium bicolor]|uniref:RING-type E3 ubiquitin transferase n=1 Tax=Rhamnusium bicolor TaxID=1586634 RepID=A0AAV8ZVT8_9CUCU|nr:hypothetical protein NQ314_000668 [Rhamnusium bicolor]
MDSEAFKIIDKCTLENENICANCQKLLNVVPVYCIDRYEQVEQRVEQICGRCEHIVDTVSGANKWRQYAYENFAKYLTYPCSNKKFGCDAILNWDGVLKHENICTFQCANCPLFYKNLFPDKSCSWLGNVKMLDEHIENSHKDCMCNPPQCDWIDSKQNTIFFTRVGSQMVTIIIKYARDSKYYCLLMVSGNDLESQCFRYQLELFDENKNNSIILRKARLEPLGYMKECIENSDKMLEIDIDRIKEMLKNTKNISGRFGIVKKNRKEIAQITGIKDNEILTSPVENAKNKIPPPDEIMLQELECPVCSEHMIPPIYICETG